MLAMVYRATFDLEIFGMKSILDLAEHLEACDHFEVYLQVKII